MKKKNAIDQYTSSPMIIFRDKKWESLNRMRMKRVEQVEQRKCM